MTETGLSAVIRSSEDIIKQYQDYLRKYENDDKLVILEAVDEQGTNPGDNYLSIMIRTKVVGTYGDGRPYTNVFLTKKIIQDVAIIAMINLPDLFCMEAYVYSKILPVLGSFGPRCVHADKNAIIMEDLTYRGYAICERRDFLDLDHTIFVLKKLAKLHASALAIKINNPQQFDTMSMHLKEIIFAENSEGESLFKSCGEVCVKSLLQHLDNIEPQTQESQAIRNHIATYLDKTFDTIRQLFIAPKQKYDTVCHGDLWLNNLLFLHDNNGRIVDLKIVDYQIIRHTSIATDILHFIYSSVQSSLIERSFESLIKIYHNEFLSELRQSYVDEKILKELAMEWLNKELRTYAFYGLLLGKLLMNALLAEEKDIPNFKTIDYGPLNSLYKGDRCFELKKFERTKSIVFHYYRRFKLGIINDDVEPISIL